MALSFATLSYDFLSHPYNLLIQGLLAVVIAYFFLKRNNKDNSENNKKLRDVDEFLADWTPATLPTELSTNQQRNLKEYLITESNATHATVNGKENVLHAARSNYLGLSGDERLNKVAEENMRKYGVGSCGPRGFYGTIDTHIFLENRIARFLGTEDAILYSSAFCTTSSTIPCFSKRGDLIICDRGVTHHIQTGIKLARSDVKYFNHNDMADLERILIETMPKHPSKLVRKFVVVEGLYYNYGDLCPLKDIMELKEKYKFRLILDESHSIGTLGATGRGVTELSGVDRSKIEFVNGNLSNGFGSSGGFCAASKALVYHQRLQGSGYIYSASLPPFLSACSEASIDLVEANPELLATLAKRTAYFHERWAARAARRAGADSGDMGLEITSARASPVIHLRTTPSHRKPTRDAEEDALEAVCAHALTNSGVFVSRAKYVDAELFMPPPSIRVCMNAAFSEAQVDQIIEALGTAIEASL